jgi:PAS domain-containing protein
MPGHQPVWFQRLPIDLRRKVELAEAAARQARYQTHAAQALDLVAVLAPRMPFDEAVERYLAIMNLSGEDAEIVRQRALLALGDSELSRQLARERHRTGWGLNWRYATPLGAVRFVRRHLRRNAEEDLWTELAAARAEEALILTHVQHARIFAELLDQHAPPPRTVSFYLDRLDVPASRAYGVYQRTLATLAESYLPRLLERVPSRELG